MPRLCPLLGVLVVAPLRLLYSTHYAHGILRKRICVGACNRERRPRFWIDPDLYPARRLRNDAVAMDATITRVMDDAGERERVGAG